MESNNGVTEERAYFLSVINTFKSYREQSLKRIQNKECSIATLPYHHKKWLAKYQEDLDKLKQCIDKNAEFIPLVLQHAYNMFDNVYSSMETAPTDEVGTLSEGIDKVQSVFKQLMRDWSSLGASERQQCYSPIIEEIELNFPEDSCDRGEVEVLVPGAGLGRLAFEIALRGFKCQGNEFNLFMLIVSFHVLNFCKKVDEFLIYPWIHQYCNNIRVEDQMVSASKNHHIKAISNNGKRITIIQAGSEEELFQTTCCLRRILRTLACTAMKIQVQNFVKTI